MISRSALLLIALAAPLAAAPQVPQVPPAPPAPPADAAPPLPPAAALAPEPPPQVAPPATTAAPGAPALRWHGARLELSALVAWTGAASFGALDRDGLARWAASPASERTLAMSVSQSRLRAELERPGDRFLAGARLSGQLELDLAAGLGGGTDPSPAVRLRQAWASATFGGWGAVSLLVGQTEGLFAGPQAAASLGHLAVVRFAGAGALERRAPQLRLSGERGQALLVRLQVALLAPQDPQTAPRPSAGAPTSVGERSGVPNAELRLAVRYHPAGRVRLEVGLSGHAGRERYLLDGLAGAPDGSIDSYGGAVDWRLNLPRLTLVGAAYAGKNLDVWGTASPGASLSYSTTTPRLVGAAGVSTQGLWGQLQVAPTAWLLLLLGGGLEAPARRDLAAGQPAPPAGTVVYRNAQVSGGLLVTLDERWRAGLELTGFATRFLGETTRLHQATQLELSTQYQF